MGLGQEGFDGPKTPTTLIPGAHEIPPSYWIIEAEGRGKERELPHKNKIINK